MIVMDSARCHLTEDVKEAFRRAGTTLKYIPGGMTPILQPLDVHLNKPIKDFLKEEWQKWLQHGDQVNSIK